MLGVSGKYRLDQRLGGGGMAEVFLASTMGAEGFSRRVAIKRVLPGFSDNESFARMFVDEARISAQLVHPNIVSVLDFDRDADNRLFLVMELVEGKDLDALVSTGLLPFSVVIHVVGEVLRGLGHAHDLPVGTHVRGVVHRDVSPHNVLLSWEGAVKVSDFGIAKARAASEATASVFIKGKPAYMSPEQANGQPLDGRSDLFAVGIMLWEMLVGRRLFVGEDTRATLAAVLFGQIPRPRSLRGDVPKDLERVVMKLLERDLPARYETAEQAIKDLLDCSDAPKAGREALVGVLAERFAAEAPVRQSRARASLPPGYATTAPGAVPIPQQPTLRAHGAPTPAAALPSLGAVMNARTGTIEHRYTAATRRGTMNKLLIAALTAVFAGVATFAVVAVVNAPSKQEAVRDAAPPAAGSDAAPAPADAAPPEPPPPAPVDAAPADPPVDAAPQKDARPRVAPQKFGTLHVETFPIMTVYVDGTRIRDTPLDVDLPVGPHKVKLKSYDPQVKDETVPIRIYEGKVTSIKRPTP
jgi:hypothetical protein